MKKRDVLEHLGGTTASAAAWLEVEPHTIHNWQVDGKGNLVSRRIRNDVLAACVRKHAKERLARGEHLDPIERKLLA